MFINKKFLSLSIVTLLVACSNMGSQYVPVVDKKGIDENKYQQDLAECQNLSTETEASGASGAKKAAGGAAVGALLGLVGGGNSTNIAQAAGIGGVIGGASGLYSGNSEKQNIIRRCLSGRGYKVLN
jgi:hypothetical protein